MNFNSTLIMGILNVTPDSFSDGGKFNNLETAIQHAKQMVAEGADIIDVGGESTRPGSEPVSAEEELNRVLPVIKQLSKEIDVPISIDTMKPEVAEECIKAGAKILNDVTGLTNEKMLQVAAKYDVPTIIMHMKGIPKTMQKEVEYRDLITEIKHFLKTQAEKAKNAGVSQIIIDPGIGFGKSVEHNLQIIKNIQSFKELGFPILIGLSRKSFIGKILNVESDQRLEGTLAGITASVLNGANILRVHDVKECRRAVEVAKRIRDV